MDDLTGPEATPMTREIVELVETVETGRVFCVEEGGIWFSGMNANVGRLASRVVERLHAEGYHASPPEDDDADAFPGVYVPVEEAEPVPDEVHLGIVSPPGGNCEDEPDPTTVENEGGGEGEESECGGIRTT